MNSATTTNDPAAIEQDIRQTQDSMSRTVDKIGEQLSIKNLVNSLLDKADENNVDARTLYDGARRNPIALGLIAAGAIWLVSEKDSKIPSLPKGKFKSSSDDDLDVHHRDYVSHMSSVEQRPDEEFSAFQRRRDLARSNFLMVERSDDEDESAFRKRLDSMTGSFREKRRAWADSSASAKDATQRRASQVAGKAQDLYAGNPLVGGILAAAIGAAFGATVPITRQEQDKLGAIGEKARDVVGQQSEQVSAQLRDKKDQLLDKADEKLQSVGTSSSDQQQTGEYQPSGSDNKPFIASS
jgi:hypothetical protein